MTPITNISIPSSTNVIMTTPPSIRVRQKQQTDLSISKPPSSTLVDLLKQRRSPPPQSPVLMTTRQKQNSIIKQPKKPSKKSQIQIKQLSVNNDNNIRVNLNN
jgi:hypothetical protein